MIRRLVLLLLLALPIPVAAEEIIAGLSQNRVAITANFDGSEILVFAAVARDAPPPPGRLDVIVTIEGPQLPATLQRKARRLGIWTNVETVGIDAAPAFYAIATTAPLRDILSETDDLRHRISIGQAIRSVGIARQTGDGPDFIDALIRLRRADGAYHVADRGVWLDHGTLIRADFTLPANLTEGDFRARIFLLRDRRVVAIEESAITVQKDGIERFLHRLALDQPLIYAVLSLGLAIAAGWLASAAFGWLRR